MPRPIALDLDGVLWRGDVPIAGAAMAVERLRAAGHRVRFVTNNSSAPVAAVEQKLAAMGIEATGSVLTSASAAATLVEAGERVLVCGGAGITEALERVGAVPVEAGDAEAVMVGFDRSFDYERLRVAFDAVRAGGRLIGTNDDPTYPSADGVLPGGGALLAAVATAAQVEPEIAGKPYAPMAALVHGELGDAGIMVGDRPSTDGRFAARLGYSFGLVLSGVTALSDLPVDPVPDYVADDLAGLVTDVVSPDAEAR